MLHKYAIKIVMRVNALLSFICLFLLDVAIHFAPAALVPEDAVDARAFPSPVYHRGTDDTNFFYFNH